MRKLIAALLTAATLTSPALAQGRDRGSEGFQAAPERSERRNHDGDRQRAQARPQTPAQARTPQAVPQQRPNWQGRNDGQGRNGWTRGDRGQAVQTAPAQPGFQGRVYDQRRQQLDEMRARAQTQQDRRDWQNRRDAQQDRRDWRQDRQNWQDRRGNDHRWDQNWRRDQRYDWQRYRYQNRNRFHMPRYYAPRGWDYGYRRFSLGVYLNAPLFAQNYWIDDPFDYRLPPAYGPYRWVRYYNDVLLVDTRSGYVVDAIYDFFW